MHPSIPPLLRYFEYKHLPLHLQVISKPFHDLAYEMADKLGEIDEPGGGAQFNRCLHKLLEAKDCAVRSAMSLEEE